MFQSVFSHSFPFCIYSGRHVFESVFMELFKQVHYPSVIRLPHTLSFSSHALAKFCCSSFLRFCHYVTLSFLVFHVCTLPLPFVQIPCMFYLVTPHTPKCCTVNLFVTAICVLISPQFLFLLKMLTFY